MPIIISPITVENPDEILNAGLFGAGAVIRLQTSSTETGTFADVSGAGSTPTIPVVTATRSYSGYDPNGIVSSWYRIRYENVGATRLSDWLAAFQPGDETGGLLCSVYDVEQELGQTLSANDREIVLDKIRQVTVSIEGYTGRWFVPRPLSGTTTYRLHSEYGRTLIIPVGIRSITTLSYASNDQPETGGTYTAIAAANFWLAPVAIERTAGWPATKVYLSDLARFYDASFGVSITGQFGWASVPYDIQGVAIRSVVRRYIGATKGSGGAVIAVGPQGTEILLPDTSPSDRAVLEFYRDRGSFVA